jgi:hypothetical protein
MWAVAPKEKKTSTITGVKYKVGTIKRMEVKDVVQTHM